MTLQEHNLADATVFDDIVVSRILTNSHQVFLGCSNFIEYENDDVIDIVDEVTKSISNWDFAKEIKRFNQQGSSEVTAKQN